MVCFFLFHCLPFKETCRTSQSSGWLAVYTIHHVEEHGPKQQGFPQTPMPFPKPQTSLPFEVMDSCRCLMRWVCVIPGFLLLKLTKLLTDKHMRSSTFPLIKRECSNMSNNYLKRLQDTSLLAWLATAGKPLVPGGNISHLGNPERALEERD